MKQYLCILLWTFEIKYMRWNQDHLRVSFLSIDLCIASFIANDNQPQFIVEGKTRIFVSVS